ncbi:MAG: hypothetical protein HUJ94_04495 [Bacteroidales bacterium]|nr:hypothetical protein [Bacteroidales bacterium]
MARHYLFAATAAILTSSLLLFSSCSTEQKGNDDGGNEEEEETEDLVPESNSDAVDYDSLYDPVKDGDHNYLPMMERLPKKYWSLVYVLGDGRRNDVDQSEMERGLQYHLLAQSVCGLANRAVSEGKSDIAVWLYDHEERDSYKVCRDRLENMGIHEQGRQTAIELAANSYGPADGVELDLRHLFNGYVLTNVKDNPESGIVAAVASHVYNSVIVDVRDEKHFKDKGLTMTYDATAKSTADAWKEFKDKCSNKSLVVMPVGTGELREYAIANNLFVLNLNREQGSGRAENANLLKEVLAWLEPGAPVLGWESGVGEDVFVNQVSLYGKQMIACDWSYNCPLTSLAYKSYDEQVLVKNINPRRIKYTPKKRFAAFVLTDGDNVQWMMNGYEKDFLTVGVGPMVKMGYGIAGGTLPMMAPAQMKNLVDKQPDDCSYVEELGGGYYYVDNYGNNANRSSVLKLNAERLAAHMRQHRIKVLEVMGHDVTSSSAKEAYQAFIDANDQLEGIVSVQYSPYAGGRGEIMWFKNKAGYNIPVITLAYCIWNHGTSNQERQGSPAWIANLMNTGSHQFNAVGVHAWSNFTNIGAASGDFTGECTGNGTIKGAGAARLCAMRLKDVENVSIQELIWQLRMQKYPEETKNFLKTIR